MKIIYSKQAMIIINALKNFDKKDFEKWKLEHIEIGNSTIMAYLIERDAKKGKNKGG